MIKQKRKSVEAFVFQNNTSESFFSFLNFSQGIEAIIAVWDK
jgi:hypothetical protein